MFKCGFVRSNFALAMMVRLAVLKGWSKRCAGRAWYVRVEPSGLLAADAGHDLECDRLRDLLVGVELHGVRRAPLGARAEVTNVAEHLAERHPGSHHVV